MNTCFKWAAAAVLSVVAMQAQAAVVDTSAYDTTTNVVDDALGNLSFDTVNGNFAGSDGFSDLFVANTDLTDDSTFNLDFGFGTPQAVNITGATESHFGTDIIELLFEESGTGYLVTFETTGGIDFTSTSASYSGGANARLDVLTVAAIPLPATLPLVLAGIGALTLTARRRKTG